MSEYETGRCVIGSKPHHADDGTYVCRRHLERLAAMLRDIEDEAIHLDARPSMAIHPGSGKGNLASQRTPVRLNVLVHNDIRSRPAGTRLPGPACIECWHDSCTDIRAWLDAYDAGATEILSILDTLGSWARLVREERDLTTPDRVTVTSERDTLSRQLSWIAGQPWVDEFHDDLRKLVGQLKALNGTAAEKPVGRCYLPADDGECGGPIWIDTVEGHAHCGRCRQVWDGEQVARLKWQLDWERRPKDENGNPLWTAEEIAAEHKVKPGTVNVWAHRRGVVSVGGYWDPRAFRNRASA